MSAPGDLTDGPALRTEGGREPVRRGVHKAVEERDASFGVRKSQRRDASPRHTEHRDAREIISVSDRMPDSEPAVESDPHIDRCEPHGAFAPGPSRPRIEANVQEKVPRVLGVRRVVPTDGQLELTASDEIPTLGLTRRRCEQIVGRGDHVLDVRLPSADENMTMARLSATSRVRRPGPWRNSR
jgi:hypothetical protein